jgi:hypothetical protein
MMLGFFDVSLFHLFYDTTSIFVHLLHFWGREKAGKPTYASSNEI